MTVEVGWPGEEELMELLSQWSGHTAFEIPLTDEHGRSMGNHGDALMYEIYRELATQAGIRFTLLPVDADLMVVPPSGALIDIYSTPRLLAARLSELPDVPLVIFPSSALFRRTDPALMFSDRASRTLWMLRERSSYDQLLEQWGASLSKANVALVLSHDVVALGHDLVPGILRNWAGATPQSDARPVVAARVDMEAAPLASSPPQAGIARTVALAVLRRLPHFARRWLRRLTTSSRRVNGNAALVQKVSRIPDPPFTPDVELSRRSLDLSDPTLVSRKFYATAILSARTIVTNRLHVALPAAALGAATYLVDTGYHKLSGVYERSLAKVENAHFVERA